MLIIAATIIFTPDDIYSFIDIDKVRWAFIELASRWKVSVRAARLTPPYHTCHIRQHYGHALYFS